MLASELLQLQWSESEFMNRFIERAAQQCLREALMRVIKARHPEAVTLDVQWVVARENNLGQLRAWIDAAATAQTAEAVVATLLRNAS